MPLEPSRPWQPSRRGVVPLAVALALAASLAAGCGAEAVRALDAQAAANGTAGAPNNGAGGRGGGN